MVVREQREEGESGAQVLRLARQALHQQSHLPVSLSQHWHIPPTLFHSEICYSRERENCFPKDFIRDTEEEVHT